MKTTEPDRIVLQEIIVVIYNEPAVVKPTTEEEKNFVTRIGPRVGRLR